MADEGRKSVAGMLGHNILPTVESFFCMLQRRLIPGRQLVQNAGDLDYYSRKHASEFLWQTNPKYQDCADNCSKWCLEALPLALLCDFAAAFPWAVSFAIKILQSLFSTFKVLYCDREGVACINNISVCSSL